CWRLDRIFPSIAAAIRPGDRWGRRDLFSRLPSSPSRRIHLYTVFGLTLKRRHSSRTFTPGCLPKATISFRNPTVWTTSFQANSMHLPASNYPNSGVTHVREHVLPMSEVHTKLGGVPFASYSERRGGSARGTTPDCAFKRGFAPFFLLAQPPLLT